MLNNYYQERNLINPFADFPADKNSQYLLSDFKQFKG